MENKDIQIYTKDELTKADNSLLNSKQLDLLLSKTPPKHIHTRPAKGGGKWDFVTGVYMKKVLNFMFGWNWDFEVDKFDINMTAMQVIVLGKLTCRVGEETIIKMQFGCADIKEKKNGGGILDLGNDLKAASTDALKKCASELGIASDVYGKAEFKEIKIQPEETFGIKHIQQMKSIKSVDELDMYYDSHPEFVNNKEFINEFKTLYNGLSGINQEVK